MFFVHDIFWLMVNPRTAGDMFSNIRNVSSLVEICIKGTLPPQSGSGGRAPPFCLLVKSSSLAQNYLSLIIVGKCSRNRISPAAGAGSDFIILHHTPTV
jgi:hypothetical protein